MFILCFRINNCVGETNRWLFVQLVLYATLMSSSALCLLLYSGYMLPPCDLHKDMVVQLLLRLVDTPALPLSLSYLCNAIT